MSQNLSGTVFEPSQTPSKEENCTGVRALPEVNISEKYGFDIILRETTLIRPVLHGDGVYGSGALAFNLPFAIQSDNGAGFDNNGLRDVFRISKEPGFHQSGVEKGRIGYFSIFGEETNSRENENIKIESGLTNEGILPLDVPISEYQDLFNYKSNYFFQKKYQMTDKAPIDVEFTVVRHQDSDIGDSGFEEAWCFDFSIKIYSKKKLPKVFLNKLDFQYPLSKMASIDLSPKAQPRFGFDPSRQMLFLIKPQLFKNKGKGANQRYIYSIDSIKLSLSETSRLIDLQLLTGSADICIPDLLLSSLDGHLYDATGQSVVDYTCSKETKIDFCLEIDLAAVAGRYRWPVENHLVFDGVIPQKGRLEDISGAFHDVGINFSWYGSNLNTDEDYVVSAEGEGSSLIHGEETVFQTVAKCARTQVLKKLALQGGGETTQETPSGRIEIQIKAAHTNFVALTKVMNHLQRLLKERLNRFRVI